MSHMELLKAGHKNLREHLLSSQQIHPSSSHKILGFGIKALDAALGGGLALGSLSEWGLPHGKQGRSLIVKFLAQHKLLTLWIYPGALLEVYPPAWQAQGADLNQLYFAKSDSPVRDLRPVFLEPLFDVIILDSPLNCSKEEQAFLAKQARIFSQGIFLLRPYFLCHEKGNPFAKFRLNACLDHEHDRYTVETLRGFPPSKLSFSASSLLTPLSTGETP